MRGAVIRIGGSPVGNGNINLDEKAAKAVGLGKAIARTEGSAHLDAVHILKAAALVYPEEVALCLRQIGCAAPQAVLNGVTAPERFEVVEDRMVPSAGLAAILRKLRNAGQVTSFEDLLIAILGAPSVRVKALLHRAVTASNSDFGGSNQVARIMGYRSKRDRLADLHTEWRLRKAAAQACGLKIGFGDDDRAAHYSADSALDAALRQTAVNRSKAAASAPSLDPLGPVANDLDEVQRVLVEGILIDQLYCLAARPFDGISARDLAQMLAPEFYPGNCRKVVEAVVGLENLGFISRDDYDGSTKLTGRIRLAEDVLEQLLSDLDKDAISAGECDEMKRKLRHGVDWGEAEAKTWA